jgi:hypothetical protein
MLRESSVGGPDRPLGRRLTCRRYTRLEEPDELQGQVDNICFVQGLELFNDPWHLYYSVADSRIGCATAPYS